MTCRHGFPHTLTLSVLLLSATLCFPGRALAQGGGPLRVMTFNIRYDNGSSATPDSWRYYNGTDRRERVYAMILRESRAFGEAGPHIVGVQEALDNQVRDLKANLPGYGFYGVGRDNGMTNGEFCGIFFREDAFALKDSGTFWLSPTPTKPGSFYPGAACTRIASWVRLEDRATSAPLFVLNTHWDHVSAAARSYSALLIADTLTTLSAGMPAVVMGDLNTTEDTQPLHDLISGAGTGRPMVDAYREAIPERSSQEATYHDWTGRTSGSRIDFVLYTAGDFRATSATIENHRVLERWPSDHYPVTATLSLPPAAADDWTRYD